MCVHASNVRQDLGSHPGIHKVRLPTALAPDALDASPSALVRGELEATPRVCERLTVCAADVGEGDLGQSRWENEPENTRTLSLARGDLGEQPHHSTKGDAKHGGCCSGQSRLPAEFGATLQEASVREARRVPGRPTFGHSQLPSCNQQSLRTLCTLCTLRTSFLRSSLWLRLLASTTR